MCPSVGAFLKDGESDLRRISPAHAEFIRVESETGRLPDFSNDDAISGRSHSLPLAREYLLNSASYLHRICTARSRRRTVRAERVVYCGRRREREDIFADIRVLKKYAHSRLPVYEGRREKDAMLSQEAIKVVFSTTYAYIQCSTEA